jgi:hypothetical protein
MKKTLTQLTTLSAFCLTGFMAGAQANELTSEEDFALALKALPELADEVANPPATRSSTIKIKCFVDTPAYDHYTYNFCGSAGWARTTTAVFTIENVPAGSTIAWSNSNCSSTNSTCFIPIRQYQSVSVTANVLKPNGTYTTVSATAFYEGLD